MIEGNDCCVVRQQRKQLFFRLEIVTKINIKCDRLHVGIDTIGFLWDSFLPIAEGRRQRANGRREKPSNKRLQAAVMFSPLLRVI
jgi:hypothetical protein